MKGTVGNWHSIPKQKGAQKVIELEKKTFNKNAIEIVYTQESFHFFIIFMYIADQNSHNHM